MFAEGRRCSGQNGEMSCCRKAPACAGRTRPRPPPSLQDPRPRFPGRFFYSPTPLDFVAPYLLPPTESSTSVNNTTTRRVMDSSECHGTTEVGLPCQPGKSEDKVESCMRFTVCLSIDHGELPGEHKCVEAGCRKGRGSDEESSGTQLHETKRQNESGLRGGSQCCGGGSTDSEERDADARQQIVGPWVRQRHGTAHAGLPWSYQSFAHMKGERLVMKGIEEVENAKENSTYQDKFDCSTTATKCNWEPRGMLQLEQKIEDSAKTRRCSVRKGFDKGPQFSLWHLEEVRRRQSLKDRYLPVLGIGTPRPETTTGDASVSIKKVEFTKRGPLGSSKESFRSTEETPLTELLFF
ncbi:hypothetical protein BHE74_00039277 [Ensete ventricosum]|nr:hypothetical protein BHE74_00039277 [Ensete ventricosum]